LRPSKPNTPQPRLSSFALWAQLNAEWKDLQGQKVRRYKGRTVAAPSQTL
jgi:hypothetical protein